MIVNSNNHLRFAGNREKYIQPFLSPHMLEIKPKAKYEKQHMLLLI
jgi:hypothetical protein